jgi:hypothetical protein
MSLVSVTGFRLRSIRFIPLFIFHANRTIARVRKADGFVVGVVQRDAALAFWMLTVWRGEPAMRAYGASGARRQAMPHLADWADEACVGHLSKPGTVLPARPEAVRRLRMEERPLLLRHPVPDHQERRFAEPRMTEGMRL